MTKYALCVGNNYPGTPAQLSGCVNDALDWSELLASSGYQVEFLQEATLGETSGRLIDLVGKARFGDRIVFTYSGHGTWVPDRDGDEADRRDEAMCMADYERGGLLLDDTLQQIFERLKYGARALVLSDSCHSGTVSKLLLNGPPMRAKFISPINLIEGMTETRAAVLEAKPASTARATASLISGCGDLEYSYDTSFNGRPNGAFTRAAIDAYVPGISLGAWFSLIRRKLPTEDYPQSPQLTTTAYRKYTKAL